MRVVHILRSKRHSGVAFLSNNKPLAIADESSMRIGCTAVDSVHGLRKPSGVNLNPEDKSVASCVPQEDAML